MKAIVVRQTGGPEVLRLEDVPVPVPDPGEVVVRLHAVGVNPVETYVRQGGQGYAPPALPYTPGSDGAGVVESVGPDVTGVSVGDRVYLSGARTGTYAQLACCRVDEVHPLPEALTFAQGAALGVPYATAWYALFDRAGVQPGETVLVHGASGGVGLAAVQMAVAHGCTVAGTAGTEEGRRLVAAQGAARVYDHHADGYLDAALSATGGRGFASRSPAGFDVIVEMAAHVNLGRDLAVLAHGGRVVVVGSRGAVEITPRDLMGRHADVRGMSLRTVPANALARLYTALGEGLRAGTLRPVVARELPLPEAAEAHRAVMDDHALGKIVLMP
jgi:NADPH:quinone reductase